MNMRTLKFKFILKISLISTFALFFVHTISTSLFYMNKEVNLYQKESHIFSEAELDLNRMYETNNGAILPPYPKSNFTGKCFINHYHRWRLFNLLKFWMEFAKTHGIIWFISDGTLLGAIRHHDMIPWDTDADISMFSNFETIIIQHQERRGNITKHNSPYILHRETSFCTNSKSEVKFDCTGAQVEDFVDECTFCSPVARVFYKNSYINVFNTNLSTRYSTLVVSMERYVINGIHPKYSLNWIFPLQPCKFMGLILPCPKESIPLLLKIYGDIKRPFKCKDSLWVK